MFLNVEELATIFHFPTIDVKAGQVQRTETKRSGAPSSLPFEKPLPIQKVQSVSMHPKASPPVALPEQPINMAPQQQYPAQPQIPVQQPEIKEPEVPVNLPFVE